MTDTLNRAHVPQTFVSGEYEQRTRGALSVKDGVAAFKGFLDLGIAPIVEVKQNDPYLLDCREIAQNYEFASGMLLPFIGPVTISDVAPEALAQRLVFTPYDHLAR